MEILDTWGMSIHALEGEFSGLTRVELPRKPYMALRVRTVGS
ncbi:DUF5605 domain-containing protein [Paenibacillus sp. P26]|nr:DUF5605 domain-containing protein [Paenibacillus sp. P26]